MAVSKPVSGSAATKLLNAARGKAAAISKVNPADAAKGTLVKEPETPVSLMPPTDPDTENTEAVTQLDPEMSAMFTEAVNKQARASALEAEAKLLKASAASVLLPLMSAFGMDKFSVPGVGFVSKACSTGSNIDPAKLRENLMLLGIDGDAIDMLIHECSKSWNTPYVKFNKETNTG